MKQHKFIHVDEILLDRSDNKYSFHVVSFKKETSDYYELK